MPATLPTRRSSYAAAAACAVPTTVTASATLPTPLTSLATLPASAAAAPTLPPVATLAAPPSITAPAEPTRSACPAENALRRLP